MSTPSDTIRTATSQGRSPTVNSAIFLDAPGSSLTTTSATTLKRLRNRPHDPLCVLLVGGDHEATGIGLLLAHRCAAARAPGRAPWAASRRRGSVRCAVGPTPGRGPARRRTSPAARHRTVCSIPSVRRRGEVDRADDAAVAQRIRVAVGVVGVGEIAFGDRRRSGRTGSSRCRCGTACPTATAAWPPARTPGTRRHPTPVRGRRGGSRRGSPCRRPTARAARWPPFRVATCW